jgi:dual specificity phosphatase 12
MTTSLESITDDTDVVVAMGTTVDETKSNAKHSQDTVPRTENEQQKQQEQWKIWLESNQKKLPIVMKEHLEWVSKHTNDFEGAYFEMPPNMKILVDRLKKGRLRQQSQQQAKKQEMKSNHEAPHSMSSTSAAAAAVIMRKPTMLPVQNPLQEDHLKKILSETSDNHHMSQDDVQQLCEAVQGYHPGATKLPLENWLFDSFLGSAEEVIPNLWLGGFATAHDKTKILEELQVSSVLCVGGRALAFGDDKYHPPFPEEITYKVIDVDDTEKAADADALGNCFPDAVAFIEKFLVSEKKPILVHCMAGASRSASVVCAYLIWKYNLSVADALRLVRSARPIATPNAAFVSQLEEWRQTIVTKHGGELSL